MLASRGPQEAAAEEIEARPAKHLAFQHLEAIDVPLDRTRAPGQRDPRFDRLIVVAQPGRKASQGLQRTGGRALEPGIELRRLPLADQRGKVLRQVDGLGDLGRLRVELGELLGLGVRCASPRAAAPTRWPGAASTAGTRAPPRRAGAAAGGGAREAGPGPGVSGAHRPRPAP